MDNPHPTSQEITDSIKIASDVVMIKEEVSEHPKPDSTRIQTRSVEATKSAPTNDKREDLTALKALDVLLRKYDRRSTPTNDLGKCSSSFFHAHTSSALKSLFKFLTDVFTRSGQVIKQAKKYRISIHQRKLVQFKILCCVFDV